MAQTLKPDLREKIIDAGKREFISYGYRDSSMRRIAESCGISVGNLYNYFSGKQQLLDTITIGALNGIDSLLLQLSNSRLSLRRQTSSGSIRAVELKQILEVFSHQLAELFVKDRDAMLILLMNEQMDQKVYEWFAQLMKTVISDDDEHYQQIMSHGIATSIFEGIKNIFEQFTETDLSKQKNLDLLRKLITDYLRVFNFILDTYSTEGI
ncbi:MAG: TetR/AcrR family transcriptional regulator [Erysipelotrichaceae bacterium]|nr:TetR/AcrR family transcriptional regulator [Erysipelotrichaceae bacterium]